MAQDVQSINPVDGTEYVPTEHDVQDDEPDVDDFPSTQRVHVEDPWDEFSFPASQAVQVVKSVIL